MPHRRQPFDSIVTIIDSSPTNAAPPKATNSHRHHHHDDHHHQHSSSNVAPITTIPKRRMRIHPAEPTLALLKPQSGGDNCSGGGTNHANHSYLGGSISISRSPSASPPPQLPSIKKTSSTACCGASTPHGKQGGCDRCGGGDRHHLSVNSISVKLGDSSFLSTSSGSTRRRCRGSLSFSSGDGSGGLSGSRSTRSVSSNGCRKNSSASKNNNGRSSKRNSSRPVTPSSPPPPPTSPQPQPQPPSTSPPSQSASLRASFYASGDVTPRTSNNNTPAPEHVPGCSMAASEDAKRSASCSSSVLSSDHPFDPELPQEEDEELKSTVPATAGSSQYHRPQPQQADMITEAEIKERQRLIASARSRRVTRRWLLDQDDHHLALVESSANTSAATSFTADDDGDEFSSVVAPAPGNGDHFHQNL